MAALHKRVERTCHSTAPQLMACAYATVGASSAWQALNAGCKRTHARSRSTICCASMPLSTCCLTNTYTRGEHNPIWWSCLHAACMLLNATQLGVAEGAHDKQDALQDWVAGAAVSKNRHHHQCASTCSMDRRPQCALWSAANQTYINRGQCARAFC